MGLFRNKNKIDKTNKNLWYCLEVNFENLTGDEFEKRIASLYRKKGYYVTQTPPGKDQGVDLIAKRDNMVIIIQTKNWKGKVTNTDVLKTSGARQMFHANYAMIITSSYFTKDAKFAIKKSPRIRGMEIDVLKREFKKYFHIEKPKEKTMADKIKEQFFGKKSKNTTQNKPNKTVRNPIRRPIRTRRKF